MEKYTGKLLTYSELIALPTGTTKSVYLVSPHNYTNDNNLGYILGYNSGGVAYNGDLTKPFTSLAEVQSSVKKLSNSSDSNYYLWTLTKKSSNTITLTCNGGYNPYATANGTNVTWNTTSITYTIGEVGSEFTDTVLTGEMCTNIQRTQLIRLTSDKISGTNYLNTQGNISNLRYAAGTAGWSVWSIYEKIEAPSYTVNCTDITGATLTTDKSTAYEDDYVTITCSSSVSNWIIVNSTTNTLIDTTSTTSSTCTFSMPDGNVIISVILGSTSQLTYNGKNISKIYKKTGNCWWEVDKNEILQQSINTNLISRTYKGNFTNDEYINKRVLIYEDDFDCDSLDTSWWTIEKGFVRNYGALAFYSEDQISFENSCMVFTAKKTDGLPIAYNIDASTKIYDSNHNELSKATDASVIYTYNESTNTYTQLTGTQLTYKSAAVQTMDKMIPKYGRIQAKIKLPNVVGAFPSFWMLGNTRRIGDYQLDGRKPHFDETGEYSSWPKCGELDIMEQYPGNSGYVYHTIWGTSGSSSYKHTTYTVDTTEWHVYEIEWTSTYVNWLVDNNVTFSVDLTESSDLYAYINIPHFLLLSLQVGGMGGTPTDEEFKMYIDWIRIYEYINDDITITYNGLGNNLRNYTGIYSESQDSVVSLTQGQYYENTLVPVCGYEIDTIDASMGTHHLTDYTYHYPDEKKVKFDYVIDNITIDASVKSVSTKHYKPGSTCPDNYKEYTITSESTLELPNWTINPYLDNGCTVFNTILPDDCIYEHTVLPIVPEEIDWMTNVTTSSSTGIISTIGTLNDKSAIGITPLWQYGIWNSQVRIAIQLSSSLIGTTLDEVKTWLDNNPITVYYPTNVNN